MKLYVQNIQCFRILVRVTYAVDVSNDFPGKRTMANDGPLLLQDDDKGVLYKVSVLMHAIASLLSSFKGAGSQYSPWFGMY